MAEASNRLLGVKVVDAKTGKTKRDATRRMKDHNITSKVQEDAERNKDRNVRKGTRASQRFMETLRDDHSRASSRAGRSGQKSAAIKKSRKK